MTERILLSPPHLDGAESDLVADAIRSNWIAPLGPHVVAFEQEFAARHGRSEAAALSSGTAAIHLALLLAGVRPGDEVLCSSFTFVASANPIRYVGATPVFIDSEAASWNMNPALLEEELDRAKAEGRRIGAVVVVHLFGQSANLDPIVAACARHEVPLIEDAAEALGATYRGSPVGVHGDFATFSFNGNKVITTSGGGMLLAREPGMVEEARRLAAQARESAEHYEHAVQGYNYRLSNILAAIGRGQLRVLEDRVSKRRANFDHYAARLSSTPGISFMPEPSWGRSARWLTALLIDADIFGASREDVCKHLRDDGIEARPVWKPLHRQPLFRGCRVAGGAVAEDLFARGLCLPSGSQLTESQRERVILRLLDTPRGKRT